jgi:hypothetical protein
MAAGVLLFTPNPEIAGNLSVRTYSREPEDVEEGQSSGIPKKSVDILYIVGYGAFNATYMIQFLPISVALLRGEGISEDSIIQRRMPWQQPRKRLPPRKLLQKRLPPRKLLQKRLRPRKSNNL